MHEDNNRQKVPVAQAATEIGCDALTVRFMLRTGQWDIGVAISPDKEAGLTKWKYYIFRAKLDRFLGKSEPMAVGKVEKDTA